MKVWIKISIAFILCLITKHRCLSQEYKVLVWMSTECPLCQKYTRTIRTLHEQLADSVAFELIFPNNSKNEVKRFVKTYKLSINTIIDGNKIITKTFHTSVTPEVVLLKNGLVIYQGAIDDQAPTLGVFKQEATLNYLLNAIRKAYNNLPIIPSKTTPVGCLIE